MSYSIVNPSLRAVRPTVTWPFCLAAVTVGFVLAGCAGQAVVSERVLPGETGATAPAIAGEKGGLVYALPKTIVVVEATKATDGTVTYTVTPKIMPDPNARFRLRYAAEAFADDDLKIEVDANGLLTSGTGTVTDQSGAIAVAVAKLAGTAAGLAVNSMAMQVTGPPAKKPSYPFTRIYELREFLDAQELPDGAKLTIRSPAGRSAVLAHAQPKPDCSYSLCFRTPMTVLAAIEADAPHDFAFLAVDPTYTEGIDLRGAPLVKRVNTTTFSNGMLVSNAVNKPSSALAAANLPVDMIKGFFSGFTDLLTLRVANINGEKSLIEAQTNLLTQQKALLDARQALQSAAPQAGSTSQPPVTGTGTTP